MPRSCLGLSGQSLRRWLLAARRRNSLCAAHGRAVGCSRWGRSRWRRNAQACTWHRCSPLMYLVPAANPEVSRYDFVVAFILQCNMAGPRTIGILGGAVDDNALRGSAAQAIQFCRDRLSFGNGRQHLTARNAALGGACRNASRDKTGCQSKCSSASRQTAKRPVYACVLFFCRLICISTSLATRHVLPPLKQ